MITIIVCFHSSLQNNSTIDLNENLTSQANKPYLNFDEIVFNHFLVLEPLGNTVVSDFNDCAFKFKIFYTDSVLKMKQPNIVIFSVNGTKFNINGHLACSFVVALPRPSSAPPAPSALGLQETEGVEVVCAGRGPPPSAIAYASPRI